MTTREGDDAAESLFDDYLDAALRGDAPSIDAFREANAGAGPSELGAALGWIRRFRVLLEDPTREAGGSPRESLPAADGLPYERLGEFRLLRRLGEGGMGAVFLAEDVGLRRLVALKVLRPELAASPTAAARFEREARAVAQLRHRALVGVHAFGEHEGVRYLALELVPGTGLDEHLRARAEARERVPVSTGVRWAAELAEGLASAHAAGVVHRDVKPSNVRITPDDRALLIDFGLARDLAGDDPTLTRMFAGSPSYAPPEQLAGRRRAIGPASDVYSLGATLYETLAGDPPHAGDSMDELLQRALHEPVVPLGRRVPGTPRDLDVVVGKALEKRPEDRYPDAGAFAADLRSVLELRPIRARPPGPLGRLERWARRNPTATVALSAALLVTLVVLGAVGVRDMMRSEDVAREAVALVDEARGLLEEYEASRAGHDGAAWELAQLDRAAEQRRLAPDEDARRWECASLVLEHERRRETTFARSLALLSQADRLDVASPDLRATWALYYAQRFLDQRGHGDREKAAMYRALVGEHDDDGDWSTIVAGRSLLSIVSEPAGAEVFLFRVEELSDAGGVAGRRWVPVPWTGAAHDVSQGVPGAPLALDGASRFGVTPITETPTEPGNYLALLRLEGYEELRVSYHVDHAIEEYARERHLSPRLLPTGSTPSGFVRVALDAIESEDGYFVQRCEVTCDEYATFLAARPERIPPAGWQRTGGGWAWPVDGTHPVAGVTWEDGRAYASWFAHEHGLAERGWSADLPTSGEWSWAAFGGDDRTYVQGRHFHPTWASSRFARELPGPVPVGSFPLDESPWGIRDLAGSVSEWTLDAPADGEADDRVVRGGAWNHGRFESFRIATRRSRSREARDTDLGFRLVLRAPGE